jgi:regulator of replication initiation timing
METWLVPLMGGIGAALLGLLGTLFVQWMNRDKTRAEAKSTNADYGVKVTASAITLINELQDEVTQLRDRQKAIDVERKVEREELLALRTEVTLLRAEVTVLRIENIKLREQIDHFLHANGKTSKSSTIGED